MAPALSLAEIALPEADPAEMIRISGSRASRWTEGAYEVWLVDRGCRITQGSYTAEGDQALLWIERNASPEPGFSRVLAYFEGNVAIDPAWEMAWMFCEGLAPVKSEGKWGFIDRRGNVVIGPRWEIVSQFENGIAPVRKGGVEGYINTSGEPVCGVKLD